jgi:hypothetical protein
MINSALCDSDRNEIIDGIDGIGGVERLRSPVLLNAGEG